MTIDHIRPENNDATSVEPCILPSIVTDRWTEVALTNVCKICIPPEFVAQKIPEREAKEPPYLISLFACQDSAKRMNGVLPWFAAWLYARPGLPIAQHPSGDRTRVEERKTCTTTLDDQAATIGTWKTVTPGADATFGVAACWRIAVDRWIQLSAQLRSPNDQANMLAALIGSRSWRGRRGLTKSMISAIR